MPKLAYLLFVGVAIGAGLLGASVKLRAAEPMQVPTLLTASPATPATPVQAALQLPDNPLVLQRADPFIHREDSTGCYHFTATVPDFSALEIRSSCQLNDLKLAKPVTVWRKKASGPMSTNIWAPELHRINNRWYLYFAAGDIAKPFSIRMYVLSNSHADPTQGSWQEEGELKTHFDSFALDATTFSHNGKRYLVWAQQDAAQNYNSALWLAEMSSPTQIKQPVVQLSEPTLDWEIQGYKVNEGPAVLVRHGRVLITYSASATDERYAMGLLWADASADLLQTQSWHKLPQPVFASSASLNRFGPGHNSFVLAEDGKTDLMLYHSRDYRELRGTPLTDPNRHARIRPLYYNAVGFPVFFPLQGD
jgi:GH43 family beta-xylosidase